MALFKCVICNEKGKKTELLRESISEEELIQSFSSSNTFLISYTSVDKKKNNTIKKSFSVKTLIEFTDIFSSLLSAKLSVQDALLLMNEITENTKVKNLSKELYTQILHGETLYESLNLFPTTFSPLYRGMARLSEKTGRADNIFKHLSKYLHKTDETKQKILEALSYPLIVISFAILCCIVLLIYVIPKLTQILIQIDSNSSSQILEKMDSLYFFIYGFLFIVGFAVIFISFIKILSKINNDIGEIIDKILLKIPFLGKYILSKQTLDFSFAMELLISSGRNISESLQDSALSVSNLYYKKSIYNLYRELEKGKILSDAFAKTKIFPKYVFTWIKLGEKTGNVENVFSQIHDYFQTEVERYIKKIFVWLEPLLILITGLIIILIIANFILPIFNIYGVIL